MIQFHLNEEVRMKLPDLKIGIIEYENVSITDSLPMLKGRINFFTESLRLDYHATKLNEIPQIEYYQQCFKKLGVDPSRYRPSSEALLRRIMQGKDFPFIHSGADINNFLSLKHHIPCGLYDRDQLTGEHIVMRLGTTDEAYLSLAGRETSAAGKWITSDQLAPFGSPVVDSERTKVTPTSKNLIHIIYLPSSIIDQAEGEKLLSSFAEIFIQANGGESKNIQVID